MQATDTIKRTIAEVVADRKKEMSPGKQFLQAVLADGEQARVDFDVTITDSLTSSRRKPRYPTRNMLKVVDLSGIGVPTTGTRPRAIRVTRRSRTASCGRS